ncbi:MAG TPA: FkbM family methyltransferase [Longimicrobiales bacterium]|nr:FkbM family methyltransferase [Longimicrobiales bacterium]
MKRFLLRLLPRTHHDYLYWARRYFGLRFALRSYPRLLLTGLVRVPVPEGQVFIRGGTTDMFVYKEIFIDRAYDVSVRNCPRFIIDAGAHIGLGTVFFATRFPEAAIVAIEPAPANFSLLRRNLQRLRNVTTVEGGLWGENGRLEITNPEASPWAFILRSGGDIRAYTVDDLRQQAGAARIDILKMDIEGAEVEVLDTSESWINLVDVFILELHDRFRAGCTQALRHATRNHDFEWTQTSEYTVLTRNQS